VQEFVPSRAGPVPRVRTSLGVKDRLGALRARLGYRDDYKVVPGLYCVGRPGPDAPALLTANYKLTFDTLRRELEGVDAWLLALDTHGINVWCAAGKGLFSTDEAAQRVRGSGLDQAAPDATLVVPQFGATAVNGRELAKRTGRRVRFGPLRAPDVMAYLHNGLEADEPMRRVTFTLAERAVLGPVELVVLWKKLLVALAALFVLSGVGPHVFSLAAAWARWPAAAGATAVGVLAGALAAPVLLPWLPGRAFSLKGALLGLVLGVLPAALYAGHATGRAALLLWTAVLCSFLTMNFTGSTPYTSPSGVEKEMRAAIPAQLAAVAVALALWVAAGFLEAP
jgi:hypothetical protein